MPVTPSFGTRQKLQYQPQTMVSNVCDGMRNKTEYINPKAVKTKKLRETPKYKRIIKACKKEIIELIEPTPKKGTPKLQTASAEFKGEVKVQPKMATPSPSFLIPPTESVLMKMKPRTGPMIRQYESKNSVTKFDGMNDYSSFDLVSTKTPRPAEKIYAQMEKEYLTNEFKLEQEKLSKEEKQEIKKKLKSLKEDMISIRDNSISMKIQSRMEERALKKKSESVKSEKKQEIMLIEKKYSDSLPIDEKMLTLQVADISMKREKDTSAVDDSTSAPSKSHTVIHDKSTLPWDASHYQKDDTGYSSGIGFSLTSTLERSGLHPMIHESVATIRNTLIDPSVPEPVTPPEPEPTTIQPATLSPISEEKEIKSQFFTGGEGKTTFTIGKTSTTKMDEEEVVDATMGKTTIQKKDKSTKEKETTKGNQDGKDKKDTPNEKKDGEKGGDDDKDKDKDDDMEDFKDENAIETYLTKQFRKKVSQISATTSYNPRDTYVCPQIMLTDSEILGQANFDKLTQKYGPIEEAPVKKKFARGTLQSHSFTKLTQTFIKDFYFGSKAGTMHKFDENLKVNGKQGICIPIAAYCYAFLKHPIKWQTEEIDEIMVCGTNLYKESRNNFKIEDERELTYQEMERYCFYGNKKIRFIVDEPIVSGFIFSGDKTIFNLTKALHIFFSNQTAGILVSNDVHIAIWKDNYFYMFDGVHRTKDMYVIDSGVANVANFYDINGLVTILLQRSGYGNWPFVIHGVRVIKVYDRYVDYKVDELDFDNERDNYNIISEEKAVLLGSYHLADLCFKYMRNRQAVAVCCMALIYSRLTPAGAWTRVTLDKIMTLGTKICYECLKCADSEPLQLEKMPAYLAIGPYIIEIYIHKNMFCDSIFKRCRCQIQVDIEEFFETSTNGLLVIEKYMMAIFKQRSKFFLYDPYSRNFEATVCRDGASCLSMHTNITSMVKTILANHDPTQEIIFHIHALKVCKIIRDPSKLKQFPKCIRMNDLKIDAFKGKMSLGKKRAVDKRIAVDISKMATTTPFLNEEEISVYQMGLGVESFIMEEIPAFPNKLTVKQMAELTKQTCIKEEIERASPDPEEIIDLDSPSLSDTQLPEKPLEDSEDEVELEFMDLCSFDLTMDEVILEPSFEAEAPEGFQFTSRKDAEKQALDETTKRGAKGSVDGKIGAGDSGSVLSDYAKRIQSLCRGSKFDISGYPIEIGEDGEDPYLDQKGMMPPIFEGYELDGEGMDDDTWFWAQARWAQVHTESLEIAYIGRISEMVNTELTAFPTDPEKLYPTFIRDRIDGKRGRPISPEGFEEGSEEIQNQETELLQLTNFKVTPDSSQLVRGSINVADLGGEIEYAAPFICVMAATVAKKYTLGTWSADIVDYVLRCGKSLYDNSPVRYDQVTKLDIPKITLGSTDFKVSINYVFDSYMKQKMVEMAMSKILLSQHDMGILVTPTYACTIMYKKFLFYLYDPFGNNEVGMGDGSNNKGTGCIMRFLNLRDLVRRIMHNKKRREMTDQVEYCRFVLSSIDVKRLPRDECSKRKKKVEHQEGEEGEDAIPKDYEQEGEGYEGEEEGEEKKEEEAPQPKIQVGYKYKKGLWVIEGTTVLEGRTDVQMDLKNDHFICLCALLMAITCPVIKWNTTKVDAVFDHGNHIYNHADDKKVSNRRTIKNILIGKNFFDIIVKKISIDAQVLNTSIKTGVGTLLSWKMNCFLVQFPCACYCVFKSDEFYHLFDPYGPINFKKKKRKYKAGWVRCQTLEKLQKRLHRIGRFQKVQNYTFYSFEVTSIRRAPKEISLRQRLHCICTADDKKRKDDGEKLGKPFNEDPEWLMVDPIPWSRMVQRAPTGYQRGCAENMWNNWDVEYPKDLYSMISTISGYDEWIPEERRGKGVLFNLVVAIAMMEIYDLNDWNPAVLNSILVNGDDYFKQCLEELNLDDDTRNYDLSVDDLKEVGTIFPYQFNVAVTGASEGTMFMIKDNRFNLHNALRCFFQSTSRRMGIIYADGEDGATVKNLAFGKTKNREYFVFDADTRDVPMFIKNKGKAYILRMTTINRLTHVLALTLRGGGFYIFDVTITDLKPME
ncbi:unnamed protein product [Brassicogethes aeneus]|uniref:Uncharacterized protein n=1 Tax=Brassicogethes aeneus TaxID=1431903 RepID=A0A9P0FAW8_BRAAE|nr:unnamed protein product [Brassicogethes aeneus]